MLATLFFAAALGGGAIDAAPPSDAPMATAPAKFPAIDTRAVDALGRMSAYLRSIPAFQVTLTTQRDDVDIFGQVITLSGTATYRVKRPNAFVIDLALPNLKGQYVYDGRMATIYDGGTSAYARFPSNLGVRGTLELAEQKYGATVPLDDLFRWGEGDDRAQSLTAAHFIGRDRIDGQATTHYAFRQAGVDWQIWIADGARPVPLRVAIVATDDPARPQFKVDLAWDTQPSFGADIFTFSPPPNSRPVETVASR